MNYPDPIPGIIPFGTLTIFAGAPSVGKTTLLLEWLRRWRDGRTICGYPTHPPTAFYYISADRGQTKDYFYTKVGFSDDLHFYSVVSADSRLNVDDLQKEAHGKELFLHVMTELNPIPGSHVIIDPLAPLFISGNQNNSRAVAASLIRMSRMIEERQINITGTAHFAKQKTDKQDRYRRPQDRISGSGSFSGYSDTQMYLVDPEPPRQPYYLFGWNPRHHKPEEFKFTRDEWFVPYVGPDSVGTDDSPVAATHISLPSTPESSTVARVHALILSHGPLSTHDLVVKADNDLHISRATTYRVVRALREDRLIDVSDTGILQAKAPH
jgi:hypothetical protein